MSERMTIEEAKAILSGSPIGNTGAFCKAEGVFDGYQAEQVRAMEVALESLLADGMVLSDSEVYHANPEEARRVLTAYRAGLPKEGHAR